MTGHGPTHLSLVLVDDDFHSARLLTRMLVAHGAPRIEVLADPEAALESLAARAALTQAFEPCLVLVDLKSTSTATRDFIARLQATAPGFVIAAMSPSLDRTTRMGLVEAGAAAVFQRHAELEHYRREAAGIVSFWVRSQHLDAVGA